RTRIVKGNWPCTPRALRAIELRPMAAKKARGGEMHPKSWLRGITAVLTLSIISSSTALTADTQSPFLYMPVLQPGNPADARLPLVNRGLDPATVTLTARIYGGTVLSGPGIINPVSLILPPSSSRALRAKELFGEGVSSGWVELKTASSAISGAFFLSDLKQTSMDGAALPTSPASRLIFPKATSDV